MFAHQTLRRPWGVSVWLRLALVALILAVNLRPALIGRVHAAPLQSSIVESIEDFLSLGRNTVKEIENALPQVDATMRALLQQIEKNINDTIDKVSKTYQNDLTLTIEQVDAATQQALMQIADMMDTLNTAIQSDITLVKDSTQEVIRNLSDQIQKAALQAQNSLDNVILHFVGGVGYVLDVTTNNVIFVGSLLMLGLGLLLFVVLLDTRRLPTGLSRTLTLSFMAVFLVLFASMLVPPVRADAMAYSGLGVQQRIDKITPPKPTIIDVVPDTINAGKDKSMTIWGDNFLLTGVPTPTARLSNTNTGYASDLPILAANEQAVVDVSALNAPAGSYKLSLLYGGSEKASWIVSVVGPVMPTELPDLKIESFTVTPLQVVQGLSAQADITVENVGKGSAGNFEVVWEPYPGALLSQPVRGLEPGKSQVIPFDPYIYPNNPDKYPSTAIVNADRINPVLESDSGNDTNNRQSIYVTVLPSSPGDASSTPTPIPTIRPPICPIDPPICCKKPYLPVCTGPG